MWWQDEESLHVDLEADNLVITVRICSSFMLLFLVKSIPNSIHSLEKNLEELNLCKPVETRWKLWCMNHHALLIDRVSRVGENLQKMMNTFWSILVTCSNFPLPVLVWIWKFSSLSSKITRGSHNLFFVPTLPKTICVWRVPRKKTYQQRKARSEILFSWTLWYLAF